MRKIFIALLLVTFTFAAQTSSSKANFKLIQDLSSTKYGHTLLSFVSLHSAVKGPIDELLGAIEELIEDLNQELQELEFNFQKRTNQHNSLVIQFQQEIQDAEQDVARMEDLIANLLVPRRDQIYNRMEQIGENMEFNRKSLREETLVRQQDHQAFELSVSEYSEAIEAVDEAVALLGTLLNGEITSLIQIKKIGKSVQRLQDKIQSKMPNAPILEAMIELSISQNFSDQALIENINNALNEFRNDAVDAINRLTTQEIDAAAEFEERVQQLDLEYAEFQESLSDATIDYDATVVLLAKIKECYGFMSQREADRKQFVSRLELENEVYAEEGEIYRELKSQFLVELGVSEQALSLVESADFGSSVNLGK